jgi:hypothetical protein
LVYRIVLPRRGLSTKRTKYWWRNLTKDHVMIIHDQFEFILMSRSWENYSTTLWKGPLRYYALLWIIIRWSFYNIFIIIYGSGIQNGHHHKTLFNKGSHWNMNRKIFFFRNQKVA